MPTTMTITTRPSQTPHITHAKDVGSVAPMTTTQRASLDTPTTMTALPMQAPTSTKPALGQATVIGAGPTGLAQAALLLKRAKDVGLTHLTVVEKRTAYTRGVGLFFRQQTLDALRWLDKDSFAELEKRSGLTGKHGYTQHRLGPHRQIASSDLRERIEASGTRFQKTVLDPNRHMADVADDMFQASPRAIITMRDLEEVLFDALPRLAKEAGVTLSVRRGVEANVKADAVDPSLMNVTLAGNETLPKQGLVLLTEGSGARVRSGLTTSPTVQATGPAQRFLVVGLPGHASAPPTSAENRTAFGVWTDPATGDKHRVRIGQGKNAGNGVRWTTVSVPDAVTFDTSTPQARQASQDAFFNRYAALVDATIKPDDDSRAGLAPISGTLVDSAVYGDNLVFAGDAVGTNHFKAAGGAATGITTHVASLNRFLDTMVHGTPRAAALAQLDHDLRASTLAWALHGLPEFTGDPWTLRERYLPKNLVEPLLPKHLLERYWPAQGGVPNDPKSPWHTWLNDAPAPVATPAQTATLLQSVQGSSAPVVTSAAWTT